MSDKDKDDRRIAYAILRTKYPAAFARRARDFTPTTLLNKHHIDVENHKIKGHPKKQSDKVEQIKEKPKSKVVIRPIRESAQKEYNLI
jgi:hypothetical protein